jgi:hypothetical protein
MSLYGDILALVSHQGGAEKDGKQGHCPQEVHLGTRGRENMTV